MDKMRKTDMTARERTSHEQDHSTSKKHHHHTHAHSSAHGGGHHLLQVEDLCVSFPCMSKMTAHDLETIYVRKNMRFG